MRNPYQKMTDHIHPPEELNERVLAAARGKAAPEQHRSARRWGRAAVCAACALALVLGTWSMYPGTEGATGEDDAPVTTLPTFSFGLTAYAAGTGEALTVGEDGTLTFHSQGEMWWSESGGCYTGFLFQINGQGVETVSLSLDRGELYRWRYQTGLTEEASRPFRSGQLAGSATPEEDGTWTVREQTRLGSSVTEEYDPDVRYGLWVTGAEADWQADARTAARDSLEELDGGTLTVTVTFSGGQQAVRSYRLSAEDGTLTATPEAEDGGAAETASDRFQLLPYGGDRQLAEEQAARGTVTFSSGSWAGGGETGNCLSQIFCVQGEDIATVSASLDRGAFWRGYIYAGQSKEELPDDLTLARQQFGDLADTLRGCNIQGRYMTLQWDLDNGFTENYDPRFCYGLRILPEEEEELRQASEHQSVFDFFDGAEMTVTVTFTDGTVETQKFRLDSGYFQGTLDEVTGLYVDLKEDDGSGGELVVHGVQAQRLDWPVQGDDTVRTSNSFGGRWQPGGQSQVFHDGMDVPAAEGTPVLAAADGTIKEIGFDAERGNYIVLDHGGGLETLYGQCRDILSGLEEGDAVSAGEMIAAVGSTGMSTGAHLHFEVLQDGEPRDPVDYFDSDLQELLLGS